VSPSRVSSGPTPVDASSFQLEPVTGEFDSYIIQIPQGWQTEEIAAPGGFIRRYVMFQSDTRTRMASITLRCEPGAAVDLMMQEDAKVVDSVNGKYGLGGTKDVRVANLSGKQTDYTVTAGAPVASRVVYLGGASCGWRILFQVFGGGELQPYAQLFDKMLATFQPGTPGG